MAGVRSCSSNPNRNCSNLLKQSQAGLRWLSKAAPSWTSSPPPADMALPCSPETLSVFIWIWIFPRSYICVPSYNFWINKMKLLVFLWLERQLGVSRTYPGRQCQRWGKEIFVRHTVSVPLCRCLWIVTEWYIHFLKAMTNIIFPNCTFPTVFFLNVFSKCTWLTHLLSFGSLLQIHLKLFSICILWKPTL